MVTSGRGCSTGCCSVVVVGGDDVFLAGQEITRCLAMIIIMLCDNRLLSRLANANARIVVNNSPARDEA